MHVVRWASVLMAQPRGNFVSMSQTNDLPRRPTRVVARPTNEAFAVESLLISGAGQAQDWVVNDIEIDGRSQLSQKDLPGALFGIGGVAATPGASTVLSLQCFEPVERDREFALVVTYVGPNPDGVPFFAFARGSRPPQRPTVVPLVTRGRLQVSVRTTIAVRVLNSPFQVEMLKIDDGVAPGGSADWIVHDLRIDGCPQFEQSKFAQLGDVPGDMFSTRVIEPFVKIDPCQIGSTFEIDVSYIGMNQGGCVFAAHLEGTVTRPDYTAPPPDLHVVVTTSGQGPGDVVVATCDWRPPAICE